MQSWATIHEIIGGQRMLGNILVVTQDITGPPLKSLGEIPRNKHRGISSLTQGNTKTLHWFSWVWMPSGRRGKSWSSTFHFVSSSSSDNHTISQQPTLKSPAKEWTIAMMTGRWIESEFFLLPLRHFSIWFNKHRSSAYYLWFLCK